MDKADVLGSDFPGEKPDQLDSFIAVAWLGAWDKTALSLPIPPSIRKLACCQGFLGYPLSRSHLYC